jgi:hypothetical protein
LRQQPADNCVSASSNPNVETLIDELKGERWFCTEEEARDAAWRAPKS